VGKQIGKKWEKCCASGEIAVEMEGDLVYNGSKAGMRLRDGWYTGPVKR